MVCQRCGIKGHNRRTCKDPPLGENKSIIVKNVKNMLYLIENMKKEKNKIKIYKIIFDYLVFNKWFVFENEKFKEAVISKLMEEEFKKHFDTKYYMNKFNPKIKKINIKECPICYDTLSNVNVCTTKCGHSFCMDCMVKHLKNKSNCPMCRNYIG